MSHLPAETGSFVGGLEDQYYFLRMTPNDDSSLPAPRRYGNRRKIDVDEILEVTIAPVIVLGKDQVVTTHIVHRFLQV